MQLFLFPFLFSGYCLHVVHLMLSVLYSLLRVCFYASVSRWFSHWSLRDSKSPQVFRTLLSILANLNNAVVWMISTRPLISKSSSFCTNPLVNVPSIQITIDITIIFMFHSFSILWLGLGSHLSFRFLSFSFTLGSTETVKSTIQQVLFFCWLSQGLFVWPRLDDLFVSHPPWILCVSFTRTDSELCIYHCLYLFGKKKNDRDNT